MKISVFRVIGHDLLLRVATGFGIFVLLSATGQAQGIPQEFALPKRWFLDQNILWPALLISVALAIWLRARNWKNRLEGSCSTGEIPTQQQQCDDLSLQEEPTQEQLHSEGENGFTLVELLVVLAIISILAAIGVSNYQNASIRARVAACESNMRVIESAIIQYKNDFARYPAFYRGKPGDPFDRWYLMLPMSRRLSVLTTPMRYITTVPTDPFPVTRTVDATSLLFFDTFDYCDADSLAIIKGAQLGGDVAGRTSGAAWRLASPGPDLIQAYGGTTARAGSASMSNRLGVDYDPTNGTMSHGDIVRVGERDTRGKLPGIQRVPNYLEHFRAF